jgi:hypothetical protein
LEYERRSALTKEYAMKLEYVREWMWQFPFPSASQSRWALGSQSRSLLGERLRLLCLGVERRAEQAEPA